MPPLLFPRLLRRLAAAAIILGMTAAQAAAVEKIRFLFSNNGDRVSWFEAAGAWIVLNGKYVGRVARDPEAISLYTDLSGGLSSYSGIVLVFVPKGGTAYVLVRGESHILPGPGNKRAVSGYLLGLSNRLGNTHLRVLRRDEDGEEKVLCDKLVKPEKPAGPQLLEISVVGSVLSVGNSDVECRGFDRLFVKGRLGLVTKGGGVNNVFKVDLLDILAK